MKFKVDECIVTNEGVFNCDVIYDSEDYTPALINSMLAAGMIYDTSYVEGAGGGDEVDHSGFALKSELHTHSNKAVLDGITAAKVTAWDGKANASHTHTIANVTDLQTTLDGKAAATHSHTIAQVTNLQTTLDGKAASTHTHTVAQISDLTATAAELNFVDGVTSAIQTQLNGKAPTTHTHTIAQVTSLQAALDAKLTATKAAAVAPSEGAADVAALETKVNDIIAALKAAGIMA